MLLESEIAEEYKVTGKKVLTPGGWKDIKTIYKTIPLPVWCIETTSTELKCSKHHLVKTANGPCKKVYKIGVGEFIETIDGNQMVTACYPTGKKESLYDITVDSEDGLFYSNSILSHNSTTFCARQLITSHLIPNYKSMYVVPMHEQMKTYAYRYKEMEGAFINNTGKQNVYSKIYYNSSSVDIVYCLTSSNKIRGKTIDTVLIDEAQNMDPDIIPEITYTQQTSEFPMLIYAGTALTTETLLHYQWIKSSQGVWMVRSPNNKDWIDTSDKDTLLKICNNPTGPVCPYTNRLLDVTNGLYVHKNTKSLETGDIGLHVPQVIIPDMAYDPLQWVRLVNNIKNATDMNKIYQEAFGISMDKGRREITENDLQRICVLDGEDDIYLKKIKEGYYTLVVSGVDWGGSDYNPLTKSKKSFTVHGIFGITADGYFDILKYTQYYEMNYEEIIESIMLTHKTWNAKLIATDAGVGQGYNNLIRKHISPDQHFIMNYVGPKSAPLSYPKGYSQHNQLSLNKSEVITQLFRAIKSKPIPKIRARTWDRMSQYLVDFLAVYRELADNSVGESSFVYRRNPQKPDDALHSAAFGYALARFYMGEPIVADPSLDEWLRNVIMPSGSFHSDGPADPADGGGWDPYDLFS